MIPALALGLVVGIVARRSGRRRIDHRRPGPGLRGGHEPGQAIPTSLLVVGVSSLAALLPAGPGGLNWP